MTAPLAFVDTETTGVHPGRVPWEIAIIRREPDGEESMWVGQVDDPDLSNADPFGLKVGGFYERHWQYGNKGSTPLVASEETAARIVEEATRGAHIVGVVPNFDTETLDAMLRRHRLIPAWHYHLIDVEALAVGYLHGRITEARMHVGDEVPMDRWTTALPLPWRSDDLSRACGVEPPSEEDRHTALGDALWAKRWYDAIVGGAR
jgi:hypothetical protein